MPAAKKLVVAEFHLGDSVKILHTTGMSGKIIELRGPLGPGGAAVYRVQLGRKPLRYVEVLGDQLEVAPKPAGPTA